MKQYRITSTDLTPKSEDDCYIDPADPIWDLIPISALGGLGGTEALAHYNSKLKQSMGNNKGQIQREQNIRPGSEKWFKLWFGK